jgi:integrase
MQINQEKFIEFLKLKGLKENTIEVYSAWLYRFDYEVFTQETVNDFLSRVYCRNSLTARAFIKNLKAFIKMAYRDQEPIYNAAAVVEMPQITGRKKKRLPVFLTLEEVKLLESAFDNEKERIMVLLCFYGGFRLSELMTLRFKNFNSEKWKENKDLPVECTLIGKGDQEDTIFTIPPELFRRIVAYVKNDVTLGVKDYLFVKDKEGSKIKNFGRTFQYHLREAGIKAGLTKVNEEGKLISGKFIHPHSLRHSCATYLHNKLKWDIRDVQEALRHKSITSTQIYTHVDKDELKKRFMQQINPHELPKNE